MHVIVILIVILALSYLYWAFLSDAVGRSRNRDREVPLFEPDYLPVRTAFYRVGGLERRNADGVLRMDVLRDCLPGDELRLERVPVEHRKIPRVLVRVREGAVLGELDETASAVLGEAQARGLRIEALLAEVQGSPYLRTGVRVIAKVTREVAQGPRMGGGGEGESPARAARGQAGPTTLWV